MRDLVRAVVAGRSSYPPTSAHSFGVVPDVFVTEPEEDGAASYCAFRGDAPSPPLDMATLEEGLKFLQQPTNIPRFKRVPGERLGDRIVMPRKADFRPASSVDRADHTMVDGSEPATHSVPMRRDPVKVTSTSKSKTLKRRATAAFRTLASNSRNRAENEDTFQAERRVSGEPTKVTISRPNRRPLANIFNFRHDIPAASASTEQMSPRADFQPTVPQVEPSSPASIWSIPTRPSNPTPPVSPPTLPFKRVETPPTSPPSILKPLPPLPQEVTTSRKPAVRKGLRSRPFSFLDLRFRPSLPGDDEFTFETTPIASTVNSCGIMQPFSYQTEQVRLDSLHFDSLQFDPAAF